MSEIDPKALEAIDGYIQDAIDAGELPGCAWLVAQHGKVLRERFQGVKDLASGAPLGRDTIYRIYSMTKPVTAVAMAILLERGLWSPDEPVAKFLPEFEGLKGPDGKPATPIMRQLMSHSAGFGYGIGMGPHDTTDQAYIDAKIWDAKDLSDFVGRIAPIPLAYEPGSAWRYSLSMDLQGAIIERLTGKTLPDFMRAEIFTPLRMPDTDFYVPVEKQPRQASLYQKYFSPTLAVLDHPAWVKPAGRIPDLVMGGGGLFSTLPDYARFGQMLVNGGELDGVRLLKAETVALIATNQLSQAILERGVDAGFQKIGPGRGYGFNGAVYCDPAAAGMPVGRDTYQWDGASGVWFWADRENQVLFVGMIQRMLQEGMPRLQEETQKLVAAAMKA